MMVTVTRYGTRHWAVWLDGELVVLDAAGGGSGKTRDLKAKLIALSIALHLRAS